MRILISNDDGVEAPGIIALAEALYRHHDVAVVAPSEERSGVSRAVTIRRALRPRLLERPYPAHAIDGMPVDCVKLAVNHLLPWRPELVLSGINPGVNVGVDVLYSGTVGAALEGLVQGIPAVALSVASFQPPDFAPSARFAEALVALLEKQPLPEGTALNVNLPDRDLADMNGLFWARQKGALFDDTYELAECSGGVTHYTLCGSVRTADELEPGTDAWAVQSGYVSVSPLGIDLSAFSLAARDGEPARPLPDLTTLDGLFNQA